MLFIHDRLLVGWRQHLIEVQLPLCGGIPFLALKDVARVVGDSLPAIECAATGCLLGSARIRKNDVMIAPIIREPCLLRRMFLPGKQRDKQQTHKKSRRYPQSRQGSASVRHDRSFLKFIACHQEGL